MTQGTRSAAVRRGLALGLALAATGPVGERAVPVHAQPVQQEYRLKGAFLYRFPQFVEWPGDAFTAGRSVQICVLHPNPFGRELEALVRGESLNGLPLAVREVTPSEATDGCHVLFVGGDIPRGPAVLRSLRGRPVLTVGEGERCLEDGGIIALSIVDRRVRFDVSVANARKAGLRISSQLLDLARQVHGGPS